jgi:hypothetical protein
MQRFMKNEDAHARNIHISTILHTFGPPWDVPHTNTHSTGLATTTSHRNGQRVITVYS